VNGRDPGIAPGVPLVEDEEVEPVAEVDDELADAYGDVRPALSPAQLAFLALIAALILAGWRRMRRSGRS
jgi:hypothetical protein